MSEALAPGVAPPIQVAAAPPVEPVAAPPEESLAPFAPLVIRAPDGPPVPAPPLDLPTAKVEIESGPEGEAELNAEGNLAAAPDVIWTTSGRLIRPLAPTPEGIFWADIAHSLSNQCRFTGHTRSFYSVAEHCCHVADIIKMAGLDDLLLTALMHDASEAYLADIARPIKHTEGFGEVYLATEAGLERVIADVFGLTYPYPPEIKDADNAMLAQEIKQLMPAGLGKVWPAPPSGTVPEAACWSPERAEQEFTFRFKRFSGLDKA